MTIVFQWQGQKQFVFLKGESIKYVFYVQKNQVFTSPAQSADDL